MQPVNVIESPSFIILEKRPNEHIFGAIPGVPTGSIFCTFAELYAAGVHRRIRAGIAGRKDHGVESVVLNGRYNDQDYGKIIVYTGCGGGGGTNKQVAHQSLERPEHRAFVTSLATGKPVRVIRGYKALKYAPMSGYRYDGLYRVIAAEEKEGPDKIILCHFKLRKIPDIKLESGFALDVQPNGEGSEENPIVIG